MAILALIGTGNVVHFLPGGLNTVVAGETVIDDILSRVIKCVHIRPSGIYDVAILAIVAAGNVCVGFAVFDLAIVTIDTALCDTGVRKRTFIG